MTKKYITVLVYCILCMTALLVLLYAYSPVSKEISPAGFERKFLITDPLAKPAVLDLKYNSYYLSGASRKEIYLGNSSAPLHMLILRPEDLPDSQHVNLQIRLDGIVESEKIVDPERLRLTVDSPYFFLMHNTMPMILRGEIGKWNDVKSCIGKRKYYFEEAVPIHTSSFALRSYSKSNEGFELAKSSTDTFRYAYPLLEKQIDGLFCVDGKLHYNKQTNQLVYVYHYRNQFIVADTNLNLLYRGQTIDTFSVARIQVAKIGNDENSMLSAPPAHINAKSSVSEKYLFIHSNLMANNEDTNRFTNSSVIDVYDLSDGQYCYSFYISNYQGKRLVDFRVFGSYLAAIFDHYLILYSFSLPGEKMDFGET